MGNALAALMSQLAPTAGGGRRGAAAQPTEPEAVDEPAAAAAAAPTPPTVQTPNPNRSLGSRPLPSSPPPPSTTSPRSSVNPSDRKWAKRVAKEWALLRDALPSTIWARAYESRMDLLRAAMLGPSGTPYHDNLFLFDFHFGENYPNDPPVAHYHSHGHRVNPNLYQSGKVCLSLLHTWQGKGSEVWNAETSNMLQVLVSIQGLVLVDKPYYNEAGYEAQVGSEEGERNGAQYNEQAFLASAKSMLSLLKKPPKHFERLIREHFRARGGVIVRACEAYLGGCPVGAYVDPEDEKKEKEKEEDEEEDEEARREGEIVEAEAAAPVGAAAEPEPERAPPSGGFKLLLEKLLPKLRAAFEENSALAR